MALSMGKSLHMWQWCHRRHPEVLAHACLHDSSPLLLSTLRTGSMMRYTRHHFLYSFIWQKSSNFNLDSYTFLLCTRWTAGPDKIRGASAMGLAEPGLSPVRPRDACQIGWRTPTCGSVTLGLGHLLKTWESDELFPQKKNPLFQKYMKRHTFTRNVQSHLFFHDSHLHHWYSLHDENSVDRWRSKLP